MPTITLFVTSKWQLRSPVLPIPGYGIVARPNIDEYFQTGSEYAANWLLKNGYCIVAPFIPGASGADHISQADLTTANPDIIHDKLEEMCLRSAWRPQSLNKPTHIICSGAGIRLITREIAQLQLFHNVKEISPGVLVPSIMTGYGYVDIVSTSYLADRKEGSVDIISYFAVDLLNPEWYGVYPYGGIKSLEPQICDFSHVINGLPTLNERMILMYGILNAKVGGQGIDRLDVTAPSGSIFVE